jgi:phage-related baseplate assembly protein
MTIDLSRLSAPAAIEQKDYETILAEMKADLIAKNPDLAAALDNESEPVTQQLEVSAYREYILRQEFNDRLQGLLLAYATGSDLDHIGVTYFYTERLVIDAGNPTAVPPVDPVYESDDDYRARCLIAEDSFSTAGPEAAYQYHVKSASGDVLDVSVVSPTPGQVVVTVLSRIGDGTPDAALLTTVTSALADDVRPMTDEVIVQAATVINYTVNATLTAYAGFNQANIQAAAAASLQAWVATQHLLGRDITDTGIKAALKVEGVHDVTLNDTLNGTDLTANLIVADTGAAYCTGITVAIGGIGG